MKTLLVAASALGLLASAPAMASDGEIALNATVVKACGVGNHLSGATAAPGWDQSDINVDLTNANNGQFSGAEYTNRAFGNLWCNGPATVTMAVGALKSASSTTDTGSFTNSFDIRVTTDAGVYLGAGEDYVISTAGTPGGVASATSAVSQAFETGLQRFGGADKIEVLKDATNRRPVSGTYAGYVRFTATAN